MQRFTAITSQLMLLGYRSFDNADLMHKVLRSLTKEWQPKVIAIKVSLKIGMPTIQELYGNPEEHELELERYKRKKSLTLKASNSFDDNDDELDDIESRMMKMKWPC